MKNIVFIIFILTSFIYGQDNIIYKKFNSFELNSERVLKIYLPPTYDEDEANTYPVTIVFDAEYLFDI